MSLPIPRRRRPVRSVFKLPPRVPEPSRRHASPSGPWPWLDLEIDLETELDSPSPPQGQSPPCEHLDGECTCWTKYPQSLFENWTPDRVKESRMMEIPTNSGMCMIHHVDVGNDGAFSDAGEYPVKRNEDYWVKLQAERQSTVRLRALFVENISVPVLQMLGTKYTIEPFFFTSSLNEIPSRYQEDPKDRDHVTITLTFIRAMRFNPCVPSNDSSRDSSMTDTQLPLYLCSDDNLPTENYALFLDLLAIHMIRTPTTSTIITYHPTPERCTTSAKSLHRLVRLAGRSVYWQHIFKASDDPTFVLLTILWHALYSWDHALARLGKHIYQLESSAMSTHDIRFTQELHKIRAYLLRYESLLDDFHKSVKFLHNTKNPAMGSPSRDASLTLLQTECTNLLDEIERLAKDRKMLQERLTNVIHLVFSIINIEDSKHTKQISYLTMFFLPASFAANIFGMNIQELSSQTNGSILHYFLTAVPLTAITIWILVAFQGRWQQEQGGAEMNLWARLCWPLIVIERWRQQLLFRKTRRD